MQTQFVGPVMAYAILRIKKLKTIGSVTAAGSHIHRKRHTPNADPSKGIEALHGSDDLRKDVEARLPTKRRINAVLAVEMLLTASPEWFRDGGSVESWSDHCLAWLELRYGRNCVNVCRHDDETTNHIHATIVPITSKGRLSCDEFFGTPQKLSQLQDDYADSMRPLGLMRGLKKTGTKRSHQSIKTFYAMCNLIDKNLDQANIAKTLSTGPQRGRNSSPGLRPAVR